MFAYPAAYASEQFLKGWVPSCASAVAGTTASATAATATAAGLRNTFTGSPPALCGIQGRDRFRDGPAGCEMPTVGEGLRSTVPIWRTRDADVTLPCGRRTSGRGLPARDRAVVLRFWRCGRREHTAG